MDEHKRWKIKFSLLMVVLIIIIYGSNYLVLGDAEHIISYIWTHLGFIPVDILVVAFLLDEIIERKEKEAMLEKLDMLMSTFFSEVGNELISQLSAVNKYNVNTENLKSIKNWDQKDFENKLAELKGTSTDFRADVSPEEREEFLENLRELLVNKREFIINLINNPNLLEKEEFTSLINAILHLDEELEHRKDLALVNETDFGHLNGDMQRVYGKLVYEWVYYLKYLHKNYPYMIALIIRTNPFDENADVYVKEWTTWRFNMSSEIENNENIKSCIILCGGQSRRMGRDKGSMIIQNEPMIKHILSTLNHQINEAIIVLNDKDRIDKYGKFINPQDYSYTITFLEDEIKNKGPMPGIMTGLSKIKSDYALVLPCDSPYVSKNYIQTIFSEIEENYQAIVPYHDENNKLKTSEPLHSIYNKNVIPKIEKLVSEDVLHIKGLIEKIDAKFVLIDNKKIEKKEFRNLNRPEDI